VVRLALLVQLKGLSVITRELASHALSWPPHSPCAPHTSAPLTSKAPAPCAAGSTAAALAEGMQEAGGESHHDLLQASLSFLSRMSMDDLSGVLTLNDLPERAVVATPSAPKDLPTNSPASCAAPPSPLRAPVPLARANHAPSCSPADRGSARSRGPETAPQPAPQPAPTNAGALATAATAPRNLSAHHRSLSLPHCDPTPRWRATALSPVTFRRRATHSRGQLGSKRGSPRAHTSAARVVPPPRAEFSSECSGGFLGGHSGSMVGVAAEDTAIEAARLVLLQSKMHLEGEAGAGRQAVTQAASDPDLDLVARVSTAPAPAATDAQGHARDAPHPRWQPSSMPPLEMPPLATKTVSIPPARPRSEEWARGALQPLQRLWGGVRAGMGSLNDHFAIVPSYHPFGLQLYLTPEGVSVGLHPERAPFEGSRDSNVGAREAAQSTSAGDKERVAVDPPEAAPMLGEVGQDVAHEVADLLAHNSLTDNESGPEQGQAFRMHRMLTYRLRLMLLLRSMGLLAPSRLGLDSLDALPSDPTPAPALPPPPCRGRAWRRKGRRAPHHADADAAAVVRNPPVATTIACLDEHVVPQALASRAVMYVEPYTFPQADELSWPGPGRRWRGTTPPTSSTPSGKDCAACVHVSGYGLEFVSSASLALNATTAHAACTLGPCVASSDDTDDGLRTLALHGALPATAVAPAALRAGATAGVNLVTDFGTTTVDARLEVKQCVVIGASGDAVARVLSLLSEQDSDARGGRRVRGALRRRAWTSVLRPLRLIRALQGQPRSTNAGAPPGDAASGEHEEPPPVVLCGSVRYLDPSWDTTSGRLLDARAADHLSHVAALLELPPDGVDRLLHTSMRAWSTLVDLLRSRAGGIQAAATRYCAVAHTLTWSIICNMSSVGAAHKMTAHVLDASARRLRALAALRSRPILPRRLRRPRRGSSVPPELEGCGSTRKHVLPAATVPAVASGCRAVAVGVASDVDRETPCRRQLWRRWRRDRCADQPPPPVQTDEFNPLVFLCPPPAAGARGGNTCPAAPSALGTPALIDAVVVVEDLRLWRRANEDAPSSSGACMIGRSSSTSTAPGGPGLSPAQRRRRVIVAQVAARAQRGNAGVVIAAIVPEEAEGGVWEWLEEVSQVKAAYGLSGQSVVIVPVPARGAGGGAAAALHNAVVAVFPLAARAAWLSSKL
jgi:hypothetical protein